PCKSPDSPGNLLARPASLKIQPIQWGGDGAYNALKQGSTVFAIMRGLAMRFKGVLGSRNSEALAKWIDDAIETELTATCVSPAFCAGILMPSKMQSNSLGG
ncbi:hypothetical protein CN207_28220, partial [Sinorhizobium meliloti]